MSAAGRNGESMSLDVSIMGREYRERVCVGAY